MRRSCSGVLCAIMWGRRRPDVAAGRSLELMLAQAATESATDRGRRRRAVERSACCIEPGGLHCRFGGLGIIHPEDSVGQPYTDVSVLHCAHRPRIPLRRCDAGRARRAAVAPLAFHRTCLHPSGIACGRAPVPLTCVRADAAGPAAPTEPRHREEAVSCPKRAAGDYAGRFYLARRALCRRSAATQAAKDEGPGHDRPAVQIWAALRETRLCAVLGLPACSGRASDLGNRALVSPSVTMDSAAPRERGTRPSQDLPRPRVGHWATMHPGWRVGRGRLEGVAFPLATRSATAGAL
jgi:hypothetical protein